MKKLFLSILFVLLLATNLRADTHKVATIRNIFVFLMVSLFCLCAFGAEVYADTHTAEDCQNTASHPHVQDAIDAASMGDIVSIPAGSCTWTRAVTVNKGIALQGAGKTQTLITHDSTTPAITITLNTDDPIRITGISIDKAGYGRKAIFYGRGWAANQIAITKLRIDNNRFIKGSRQIEIQGYIYGVIDNNEFVDGNCSIRTYGDNNTPWTRAIAAGTANALFIEDNTFTVTNNLVTGADFTVYHSYGSRTVVRYNTFDYTAYTEGTTAFFDSHGNQSYYQGNQSLDFRGQPILEVYENHFNGYSTGTGSFTVRSGSLLIYNNYFTNVSGTCCFKFYEEEAWKTDFFGTLRTVWPAQDQITNTFLWGNTINGAPITSIGHHMYNSFCTGPGSPYVCCTGSGTGTCDDYFIVKDRDYFMHAPEATGGKSTYTGRVGGSTTAPTEGDTGNLTFNSSGANAYYPYVPYTYPHPLRSGSTPTPYCGDSFCNGTETCSTCPSDCGTCPAQNFLPEQYIQAESGQLSSIQTGTLGSDTYVYTPTDYQGSVSFTFNVSQAGQYMMQAKVNSNNDGGQNSFYVGLDSENPQNNNYYAYDIPVISGYVWDNVNRRGNGTALPEFDPMIWNLTQGNHTFTFYGRESNTWLDQIILKRVVTDTTPPAAPSGLAVI